MFLDLLPMALPAVPSLAFLGIIGPLLAALGPMLLGGAAGAAGAGGAGAAGAAGGGGGLLSAILGGLGGGLGPAGSIISGLGDTAASDDAFKRIKKRAKKGRKLQIPVFEQARSEAFRPIPSDITGLPEFVSQAASLRNMLDAAFLRQRQGVGDQLAARGLTGGTLAREFSNLGSRQAEAEAQGLTGLESGIRQQLEARKFGFLQQLLTTPNPFFQEASILSGAPQSGSGTLAAIGSGLQGLGGMAQQAQLLSLLQGWGQPGMQSAGNQAPGSASGNGFFG